MRYQLKHILYYLGKILLWVCLAAVFIYIVSAVVYILLGPIQSENFQRTVFSYKAVYFVPILLVAAFLGTRYLKSYDEQRQARVGSLSLSALLTQKSADLEKANQFVQPGGAVKRPVLQRTIFSWLFAGALMSFGLYYFATHSTKSNATPIASASSRGESMDLPPNNPSGVLPAPVKPRASKGISKQDGTVSTSPKPQQTETSRNEAEDDEIAPPFEPSTEDTGADTSPKLPGSEKYVNLETGYKVINKAYFHDQPDESTRRRAFINHWNNSYATLNPLEERNGFIYVVFTNHHNQTSHGWLRKKDLKPVTTRIYEDAK